MYHLILLVRDKMEQSQTVLDAWDAAGATGITILESSRIAPGQGARRWRPAQFCCHTNDDERWNCLRCQAGRNAKPEHISRYLSLLTGGE